MAPGSGPHKGGAVRYELAHSSVFQFGGPLRTVLAGEHMPHTSPHLTVQKDFFTIDYEGVIIISIEVLRREIARELLPITFQS